MHVLVVEDDASIQQLVRATLVDEDWTVSTAGDGRAALEVVDRQSIDAILLDLQMPLMDGRTFFRQLRALPSSTPVVIMSAQGSRKAQRELGAEGALEKPFDPDLLVAKLRSLAPAAGAD
jgi:DNA-binding response OmpR family regulator